MFFIESAKILILSGSCSQRSSQPGPIEDEVFLVKLLWGPAIKIRAPLAQEGSSKQRGYLAKGKKTPSQNGKLLSVLHWDKPMRCRAWQHQNHLVLKFFLEAYLIKFYQSQWVIFELQLWKFCYWWTLPKITNLLKIIITCSTAEFFQRSLRIQTLAENILCRQLMLLSAFWSYPGPFVIYFH